MVRVLQIVAALLALLTLIAISWMYATTPMRLWASLPATGAGAVIASCVAALGALVVSESVMQRRQRELHAALREHREGVYEKMLSHMIRGFTGGTPLVEEAELRAAVGLWGNVDVVDRLSEWHHITIEIMQTTGGRVPPDKKPELQRRVAEMFLAMRRDLTNLDYANDVPSTESLASMVFSDHQRGR